LDNPQPDCNAATDEHSGDNNDPDDGEDLERIEDVVIKDDLKEVS